MFSVNVTLGASKVADAQDLMADNKTRSLAQIEQSIAGSAINFSQILQAVIVMCGAGHLVQVQDDHLVAKAKKRTDKLNSFLLNKARSSNETSFLASPVTGGGILLDRFQQLFRLALAQGKKHSDEWAGYSWQILSTQGQKLVKGSTTLETADENLAELKLQASRFAERHLPIVKALQIT